MPVSLPDSDAVIRLGQENLGEVTQSLNSCFHGAWSLEFNQGEPWSEEHPALESLSTAGLFVVFRCSDEGGFLVAIPESLPLPDWYQNPDDTQQARLQTLATEWAFQMLPEEFEEAETLTVQAHDLATAIRWSGPLPGAQIAQIAPGTDDGPAASNIWLIGPVEVPPAATDDDDAAEPDEYQHASNDPPAIDPDDAVRRVRRITHLSVKVSVRLAEMKIELASLVNLCPGTLLVFPKSCDDLLDLYVNNQLYAEGEAVKIGEKFGLKINQVGTKKQRKPGVFSL